MSADSHGRGVEPVRIEIDGVKLRPRQGRLESSSASVHLQPRVVEVALALAARPGQVVTRAELIDSVWAGYPGADHGLTACISKLRSALAAVGASPDVVETVPKSGYRISEEAVRRPGTTDEDRRPCIAVLPFRTVALPPEESYLGEALAEELHHGLSNADGIRIAARTSTFALAERARPLTDFGAQLGADLALEGSVREIDNRIGVRLALSSALDSEQLWTREFEIPAPRLGELSVRMLDAVGAELQRMYGIEPAATRDDSSEGIPAEAYRAFLKGRYFWYRENSNPGRALALHKEAIGRAPEFAAPYAGLVDCYCTYGVYQLMPQKEARRLVLENAHRAMVLAPTHPDVQFSHGYAQMYASWNWPAAEAAFRDVLNVRPDHTLASSFLGLLLTIQGRHQEAIELGERLIEFDPVSVWCWWMRGLYAFYRHDFESAAESAMEALDLSPRDPLVLWLASASTVMRQDWGQALALDDVLVEVAGDLDLFFASSVIVRFLSGQTDEAMTRFDKLRRRASERSVSPLTLCLIHSALGEYDSALDALEAAFSERNMACCFLPCNILTQPLRVEPRFRRIVQAMDLHF